ncbi:hypothetical protein Hanom_Chr06g00507301 [Helianthus anomalus]
MKQFLELVRIQVVPQFFEKMHRTVYCTIANLIIISHTTTELDYIKMQQTIVEFL